MGCCCCRRAEPKGSHSIESSRYTEISESAGNQSLREEEAGEDGGRRSTFEGSWRHRSTLSQGDMLQADNPQQQLHLLSMRKALCGVPFVKRGCFYCDEKGRTMIVGDISITIPQGALSSGESAIAEIGVALHGPFKFHSNWQPVSPILWFCFQEEVELLLPVEFKLSHTIADTSRVQLNLAKAGHATCDCSDITSCSCEHIFSFESLSDEELVNKRFTNPTFSAEESCGYAYFSTKHFCFFCLEAEISKELALEKGYSLHILIETTTYRILHMCTYFLKTSFDALREMCSAARFEHFKTINFQFANSEEPSLEINATSDGNLAIHFECGKQILCSEVDFWAGRKCTPEDMKLKHVLKTYPPKVTLVVHNKNPESRTAAVTLEIMGTKKKVPPNTIVKPFSAGHSVVPREHALAKAEVN